MATATNLTASEYQALTIDAMAAQTAAIQANTEAMNASRLAVQQMQAVLADKPLGISEAFVLDMLRLVLKQPA